MIHKRWWNLPRNDKALTKSIRRARTGAKSFRQRQLGDRYRLTWLYERDRLVNRYGWRGAISLSGDGVRKLYDWMDDATAVPSPNIVKSTVDTVVAWIINEQPPLAVRAAGARFEDQYAIEEFESALGSIFDTPENRDTMALVGRDAMLAGVGYAWPRYAFGKLTIERLLPWQVTYDPFDARDGVPKTIHITEYRDRADVLNIVENWKGVKNRRTLKNQINKLESVTNRIAELSDNYWSVYDAEVEQDGSTEDCDRLRVVHSWRVASYAGRNDGRYVMSVEGRQGDDTIVVRDEKFARTTVPVATFVPQPGDEGVNGTGFGHLMLPWQLALDRAFAKIQRALDKYGYLRLVLPGDADKSTIAAMAARGIVVIPNAANGVPQFIDPQVVRREDLEHVDRILTLSQSTYGINQMLSRGASQLGANASGQALQEEYYRSLDRFSDMANRWHGFRTRIGDELLNLLDDVLKSDPEFSADYQYLGRSHRTPWAELTKTKDRCEIALEARGEAAIQRGGRTARIQEWASQGLIDPALAKEALLTTPDMVAAARIAMAPIRLVEWQIRRVIESEEWYDAKPDADTPAEIAVARAKAAIQRATVEGAGQDTIERLREYKLTAQSLIPQALPPGMEIPV